MSSELMEVKTAELRGYALDWAVGQAVHDKEPALYLGSSNMWVVGPWDKIFNPSADWSQGGPLIEKYEITITYHMGPDRSPLACTRLQHPAFQVGDTILIASCRAIVAAKIGETVQVPRELLS